MTSPEGNGLEEALRRALSEAASGVEPGTDGLDKIRARIGDRPPRPWLLSVLLGVVDRVRNWTWRGHWAWPSELPRVTRFQWHRRGRFPRWGIGGLRLVTVLAGIAVIAAITLGIQPLRQAILQASNDLQGGGSPSRGSAGTEGSGAQAVAGTPTVSSSASGGGQAGTGAAANASGKSSTGKPQPGSAAKCTVATTALPIVASAQPSPTTDAKAGVSGIAPTTATPGPAGSVTVTPTQPVYTDASTCPVASPTKSPTATPTPTPTPTSTSSSPLSTPTATSPPAPTGTDLSTSPPAPTVSPLLYSSPPGNDSPSPSGSPSRSRPDGWHGASGSQHARW